MNYSFTDEEGQEFRELNQKRAKAISEKDLSAELHFGNGAVYPQMGQIDIAARRVDPQTGRIQARAIFSNSDGALLPGQFVRVVVRGITLPGAIVIPSQAIVQGPQGPSVYVVGENGTAQARAVRVGQQVASGVVIEDGLRPGDRVVVEGMIRVRPGAPIRPVPVSPSVQAVEASGSPAARDSGEMRQIGSTDSAQPAAAQANSPAKAPTAGAKPRATKPAADQAGARP